MVTQGSTAHSVRAPDRDGAYELLRGRYEAYCGQQAAALPAMLPRDGVRALYRSARGQVTGEVVDPLALLVQECRRVLPLPPFEIWAQDYLVLCSQSLFRFADLGDDGLCRGDPDKGCGVIVSAIDVVVDRLD